MIYKAFVKGLDPHIEEEVILEIEGKNSQVFLLSILMKLKWGKNILC